MRSSSGQPSRSVSRAHTRPLPAQPTRHCAARREGVKMERGGEGGRGEGGKGRTTTDVSVTGQLVSWSVDWLNH